MQSRKRLQSLSRNRPLGCKYRKLASLRRNHATTNVQVVTQIHHLLKTFNGLLTNFLLGNHRLNRSTVTGRKLNKAQAASVTQEKHATCNTNLGIGFFASFKLAIEISTHLFDCVSNVKMHRIRLHTLLKHHCTLSNAHLYLLRMSLWPKFFIAWVDCFIQGCAFVYALGDCLVLSE